METGQIGLLQGPWLHTPTFDDMPNIASVLKSEISRISRKEGRLEAQAFKKIASSQRAEIAALKRRLQEVERSLKILTKLVARERSKGAVTSSTASEEADAIGLRFRAAGMASNRKRLGLSAEDFGLLIGVSGQSVHSWEAGKTKPRDRSLAAIAALRGIGKREANRRLEALKQAT